MPSPSKRPPLAAVVRDSVAYAARAREHLRAGIGDARIASLAPPRADEHMRRFFFGFAMPLTMMRVAWANAAIRASIRRRLLPPLLFVGLITTIGIGSILSSLVTTRHDPSKLALEIDSDDDDNDGKTRHKKHHHDDEDDEADEARGQAIAQAAKDAKDKGGSFLDISAAAIEATKAQVDAASAQANGAKVAPSAPPSPPAPSGRVAALRVVWEFLTSKVAKLIATLSVIEWILVWIGREHHDQIAYETAVLTGVPGEPLPHPPRLRFDIGWLKMKGWRTLRLAIFFALGLPVAWIVGEVPRVGDALAVVVEAVWAVYWACVFAIANTHVVWNAPPTTRAPWFIRVLRSAGRVPVLGIPFRLYARILERATRNVWPACLAFEITTWESAGLALARAITSVPVAYIITRPAFTPAATHAFLARMTPSEPGGASVPATSTATP